ncbi:unnamed protein product, partial [Rotaria sp. Silwood2]
VDDHLTIYVADWLNNRILEWKCGATNGKVTVAGKEQGNEVHQLNDPHNVIIDKASDSLIICNYLNNRVVQ